LLFLGIRLKKVQGKKKRDIAAKEEAMKAAGVAIDQGICYFEL
jgi:hypothetical protein